MLCSSPLEITYWIPILSLRYGTVNGELCGISHTPKEKDRNNLCYKLCTNYFSPVARSFIHINFGNLYIQFVMPFHGAHNYFPHITIWMVHARTCIYTYKFEYLTWKSKMFKCHISFPRQPFHTQRENNLFHACRASWPSWSRQNRLKPLRASLTMILLM